MKINTILLFLTLPSLLLGTSTASAANFPNFTINEASIEGANTQAFVADKITGNYDEFATFDSTTNTFSLSLKWNAGQFIANDGATPVNTSLLNVPSLFTPLGYGLYGLITAQGNYVTSGTATIFNFTQGKFDLYIDKNFDTTLSAPANSTAWYETANNIDDFKVATGGADFVNGQGILDASLVTCSAGINCGSFGVSSNFELTQAGSNFFSSPNPFYNVSLSGQLNNFQLSSTQHINGSMDIVLHPVPLPAAAWMFISSIMALLAINKRKPIGNI